MSNLFEDFGLNEDIKKTIQPHTLLCICCLEINVPFVSIIACSHLDFLNNFEKPEIKPINQVICHRCHNMLKKIKQFKLQVENSFKLLEAQANNPESISHKQTNLKFHKLININITETDPYQDEQSNLETQKGFENGTCTTDNNLENIIKEENNVDNIIKEHNNFENITYNKGNNFENITYNESNNFVNIVKEENNFECTDTKLQYNLEQAIAINKIGENTNTKNVENSHVNKKLKNIETALSIINKNESIDVVSLLGTSLQDIVTSNLTSILQATDIPNVFDLITKGMDELVEDAPMQGIDDVESDAAANKSTTSGCIDITVTTLTKKELMRERKSKAKSKVYRELPHRCDGCLMGFQFKDNLDDHMKRRHTATSGSVTCAICQQELPRGKYDEHRSRHYTRYRCVNCGKQFGLYDEAVEHYEIEHSSTLHNSHQSDSRSTMCNESSGCDVQPSCTLTATEAGKRSSQLAELPTEKKFKQAELKIYKCTSCHKEFSQYMNLQIHNLRMHNTGTIPPKGNVCTECGKTFKSRFHFEKHLEVHKTKIKVVKIHGEQSSLVNKAMTLKQ